MKSIIFAALIASSSALNVRSRDIPANLVEIKEGDKKDATCERGMLATVAYTGKLKSNGNIFD